MHDLPQQVCAQACQAFDKEHSISKSLMNPRLHVHVLPPSRVLNDRPWNNAALQRVISLWMHFFVASGSAAD